MNQIDALTHRLVQAVEYFQRVIHLQQDNGEIWSALGTYSMAPARLPY